MKSDEKKKTPQIPKIHYKMLAKLCLGVLRQKATARRLLKGYEIRSFCSRSAASLFTSSKTLRVATATDNA